MTIEEKLQKLEKENGYTFYNGEKYVLLQQAYIDNDGTGESGPDHTFYAACAVKADPVLDEDGWAEWFVITWEILDSTWEYWEDGGDDEGDACDWDNADSVSCIGAYDILSGYGC